MLVPINETTQRHIPGNNLYTYAFVVYLTTLSVTKPISGRIVGCKLIRDWKERRKTFVKIDDIPVEIRTGHLPNTN
jgi:hypothetical protein